MTGIRECVVGSFWTSIYEMMTDLRDMGYEVLERTGEYIVIADEADNKEIILYLGKANRTIWVEAVRVVNF